MGHSGGRNGYQQTRRRQRTQRRGQETHPAQRQVGQFMDVKKNKKKFKGIRREKTA
jgi:hypothetical protein